MIFEEGWAEFTIHGNGIVIEETGVLILGAAGVGKTTLSIKMLNKGHKLVSDDAVVVKQDQECWVMMVPDRICGLMYRREEGLLSAEALYGESVLVSNHSIDCIAELGARSQKEYPFFNTDIPRFLLDESSRADWGLLLEQMVYECVQCS